ncbi:MULTISPECIES: hypothetical protein [Pseudomonas]|uniref:hypothetical protein n=1 Tax=Pseudomonas TaxID=286 RepID=UPI0011B2A033|nr:MULTISPECIES: hypothetical protein [Pseudomonas]CAH0140763.1 hypothetical protein SRABI08_00456 [Pseudomonas carnis]CAH0150706.1 hypothetical protein SRABI111_00699 [Pseudomonas carnis]CAH0210414.1 hypothetical protein SRABI64_01965 [Pseudomonas carnis]CAH0223637.1 hypothetical protein SRABI110_02547 [Pseudomonas carnis]
MAQTSKFERSLIISKLELYAERLAELAFELKRSGQPHNAAELMAQVEQLINVIDRLKAIDID